MVKKSGDTMTGQLKVPRGGFLSQAGTGNSGGAIMLQKAPNSTLNSNIRLLTEYQNFYIGEDGGEYRGAYINLTECADSVASKIWHSGNIPIEYGTWTPTLKGETTAGVLVCSSCDGWYYRIGNLVKIFVYILVSGITTAPTGRLSISGFPFPVSGSKTSGYTNAFTISYSDTINGFQPSRGIIFSTSGILFSSNWDNSYMSINGLTAPFMLTGTGEYLTD